MLVVTALDQANALLLGIVDGGCLVAPLAVYVYLFGKGAEARLVADCADAALKHAEHLFLHDLDLNSLLARAVGAVEDSWNFESRRRLLDLSGFTLSHTLIDLTDITSPPQTQCLRPAPPSYSPA